MLPEEKMARRLLIRHELEPPFNLEKLVSEYAVLEKRLIPFSADGISIDIDGKTKPRIIINSLNPNTRQRFTLAHELGHIIIPWHTGTILSHTKDIDPSAKLEYKQMEAEANRFAAELLLPSDWIIRKKSEIHYLPDFLEYLLNASGASIEAAFIKVFNTLNDKVVLAEIDLNGKCINYHKTKNVPYAHALKSVNVLMESPFVKYSHIDDFYLSEKHYIAWSFEDGIIEENDPREWREILSSILEDCDAKDLLASINAVLPGVYQRNKEKPANEICSKVIMAYEGREKYKRVST